MSDKPLEHWMRGPVEGIIPMLQPVAHALLQARDEVNDCLREFPETMIWAKPGGLASVGFHLQHLRGVVDRLFTYARNEQLNEHQFIALRSEGIPVDTTISQLLTAFDAQVDLAISQLRITNEEDLLLARGIGRKQIPGNVIGLLFHAAEHTMRHAGQLLVTAKVLGSRV
jgi:uncharacterized damage-inducible protein DinB